MASLELLGPRHVARCAAQSDPTLAFEEFVGSRAATGSQQGVGKTSLPACSRGSYPVLLPPGSMQAALQACDALSAIRVVPEGALGLVGGQSLPKLVIRSCQFCHSSSAAPRQVLWLPTHCVCGLRQGSWGLRWLQTCAAAWTCMASPRATHITMRRPT